MPHQPDRRVLFGGVITIASNVLGGGPVKSVAGYAAKTRKREQEAREKPGKDGPDRRRYRTGEAVIEATRRDSNSQSIACRVGEGWKGEPREFTAQNPALSRVTPQKDHRPTRGSSADSNPMRSERRPQNSAESLTKRWNEELRAAYGSARRRDGRKLRDWGTKEM